MPSYLRIFVVLTERKDDFPHVKERFHWYLKIESEGNRPKWQYCHTLETEKSLYGGPEKFEEVPFVGPYSVNSLNVVNHSEIEVAKFDSRHRERIMLALSGGKQALSVIDTQHKCGHTCRFFVEAMLWYFHLNRQFFGILSLESFRAIKESYIATGLLQTEPAEITSVPAVPKELKSRKSFFRLGSTKESKAEPRPKMPKKAQVIAISQPQPVDPQSLASSSSATSSWRRGDALQDFYGAKQPQTKDVSTFRTVQIGTYGTNKAEHSGRRASENGQYQSHRKRMAESLGLGKRRSSPT